MESNEEKEIRKTLDKKYDNLSLPEKQEIHTLFKDKELRNEFKKDLEKIIFRYPAPTPSEFLNYKNGWITKPFYDSIHDYIKEDFIEILDPIKNYNQIVEYGATRTGKSFLSRLLIMYIIIYIHCLRHPQLYYGLSPTTNLSIYIMSFVAEKVNQLLLDPVYKLFNMSPRFKQVKFQDKVSEEQYKNGLDNIYWSKAGTGSKMTLDSQLTLNIGTDFMSFIGSDLLFLTVSEINFFIEKAGVSHEEIFQLYSDGLARIRATVGSNYLGMVFLDSSANDEENPIEKYILNDLPKQKNVFFRQRAKWIEENEIRKSIGSVKLPIWEETGETFPICRGNKEYNARVIKDDDELKEIPKNLIINVPIDLKDNFEINILKAIKDDCGIPTRKENKFITDINLIKNIFNNNTLDNIENSLIADASEIPEELLWKKVKDKFFSKYNINNYTIKRASAEPRFVGFDLSFAIKGDPTGVCVLHKEWSNERNCIIYIIDFCFSILGGEMGINLEASTCFVIDLILKGQLSVQGIYVDTVESKTMQQNLGRMKINVIRQSVDRTLDPYQNFYSLLINEQVKAGKNIYLKNNLDSLIITKRKEKEVIDHSIGKVNHIYNGNFELSDVGIHEKDCSDAVVQAFTGAFHNTTRPISIYEIENQKVNPEIGDIDLISLSFNKLHKHY